MSYVILFADYGIQQVSLLQADNSVSVFVESTIERLTKGIAGYNQGFSTSYWSVESYPESLKTLTSLQTGSNEIARCAAYGDTVEAKRCIGYLYAIDIKHETGLPMARYLWRTRAMVGAVEQEFCFYYGEKTWQLGITWDAVKTAAIGGLQLNINGSGAENVAEVCPLP